MTGVELDHPEGSALRDGGGASLPERRMDPRRPQKPLELPVMPDCSGNGMFWASSSLAARSKSEEINRSTLQQKAQQRRTIEAYAYSSKTPTPHQLGTAPYASSVQTAESSQLYFPSKPIQPRSEALAPSSAAAARHPAHVPDPHPPPPPSAASTDRATSAQTDATAPVDLSILSLARGHRRSNSDDALYTSVQQVADVPTFKRRRSEDCPSSSHADAPPPAQHQQSLDVVDLNVRGQIITVKRKTLCHVPGSLLELMFSGRWESSLDRDAQGRVFLEFNPTCFQAVVDSLSNARAHDRPPPLASPHVPSELLPEFLSLVQYLGLQDALQPAVRRVGLRFSATFGTVELRDRKRVVDVPEPSPATLPVPTLRVKASTLAVPLLPTGTSFWKFHIHKLDTTYFSGMFVGVTEASQTAPSGYTQSCHGWQATGGVVAQGQLVGDRREFEGFEEGDNVVMRLEAHLGVLTMAVDRLPRVYSVRLRGGAARGAGHRWQVVCLFFTQGNVIEVMDPLPHEADWLAAQCI